jgi:hypothetical protein
LLSTYKGTLLGSLWTIKCSIPISMLQVPSSNLYTFLATWFLTFSITSSFYKSLDVFVNCFKIVSSILSCAFSNSIFGLKKLVISSNKSNYLRKLYFFASWNGICYDINFDWFKIKMRLTLKWKQGLSYTFMPCTIVECIDLY